MEPGEYLTNVLSCNNFATIQYEYLELAAPVATVKDVLQKVEAGWRDEGRLVHCDTLRDGVWVFYNANGSSVVPQGNDLPTTSVQDVVEAQGVALLLRNKGTYESASLARNRPLVGNALQTPTSTSSPSSSLEAVVRNSQVINPRADQATGAQSSGQEPPTPSPGARLGFSAGDTSMSSTHVHEAFLSAVLGSVVYFICRDHGFIPLNSRTLISTSPASMSSISSTEPGDAVILSTLDISLTSLGTIVAKGYCDVAPGFQSLFPASSISKSNADLLPGTPLWLAPGGIAGKLYSIYDEEKPSENISFAHISGTPFDQEPRGLNTKSLTKWKSKCVEWLSTKGLNTAALEAGGWVFVQVLSGSSLHHNASYYGSPTFDNMALIPWPRILCFQTSAHGSRDQLRNVLSNDFDPLNFTESWFTSREERATTIAKRKRDRQVMEALSKEQADVEARNLQANTYSPAALRRGSNAGAMYPTPPDAIHHLTGATPNFEGAATTPSNQNLFGSSEIAPAIMASSGVPDMEADLWGTSETKDLTSSATNFNNNDNDNDNIFGDIGGDIFGADVTDADFNFFDMPDIPEASKATPEDLLFTEQGGSDPMEITSSAEGMIASNDSLLQSQSHVELTARKEDAQSVGLDSWATTAGLSDKKIEATKSFSDDAQALMRPPFDKEAVFRKLVCQTEAMPEAARRASIYSKIDFEQSLSSVDQKYGINGRFSFPATRNDKEYSIQTSALLESKYLKRRTGGPKGEPETQKLVRIMLEGSTPGTTRVLGDCDPMDYLMGSDSGSQGSEHNGNSPGSDMPHSAALSFTKHKWPLVSDIKLDTTATLKTVDFDHSVMTPNSISGSQIALVDSDPADWSLAAYLTTYQPDVQPYALTDYERICAAQILAEQAIAGTFQLPGVSNQVADVGHDISSTSRSLVSSLSTVTKRCLLGVENCTLRSFIDIQGIPIINQNLRLPPRPIPHPRNAHALDSSKPSNLFSIPPPQLEVRRSDSKLAVSPPAINFWDILGLAPCKGAKDVQAVCVYPGIDGVVSYAKIFLDQMRSIYESARFGTHDRISTEDLDDGCLPYAVDITQQNQTQYSAALKDATSKLSSILSSLSIEETNLVVYFVYPAENAPLLVHICSTFHNLFNLYKRSLSDRKISSVNDIALQLVPLDFITSPAAIKIPSPSEYNWLSMAVYDRCTSFVESSSSPAVVLDQPLLKSIDFKLSATPSVSLLQENTCLHIAYAQSIDDRWVTAAWSDNRGTQHMTASYCLGRKNEPLSMAFSEVAHEIWQTTVEFTSPRKIHWRLMIARIGVMDSLEAEFWTGLASTETNIHINLTLLSVQTEPSLRLLPPALTLSPKPGSQAAITPVSTPLNSQSILSPDNMSTPFRDEPTPSAPTPGETPVEPDTDSRLLDFTDQTWGCILAHRLNNSNSILELNPALISGYLIKRGGTSSVDSPVVLEVNILNCEVVGNPRTFHESLLREILGYYRGLATVARVRGVIDSVGDVRPWHIAAAEKGVKALYMLM